MIDKKSIWFLFNQLYSIPHMEKEKKNPSQFSYMSR